MDQFGIGSAMHGMAIVYFRAARRTGRTLSLFEGIQEGDRIIFAEQREADRAQKLCRDRKLDVVCVTIDPAAPHKILERGRSRGRTYFDHSWVEKYYLSILGRAQNEIDFLQEESSGRGLRMTQTLRCAEEIKKWEIV